MVWKVVNAASGECSGDRDYRNPGANIGRKGFFLCGCGWRSFANYFRHVENMPEIVCRPLDGLLRALPAVFGFDCWRGCLSECFVDFSRNGLYSASVGLNDEVSNFTVHGVSLLHQLLKYFFLVAVLEHGPVTTSLGAI